MKSVLIACALLAALPALAQIRAIPEKHILRNAPPGTEEETPAVAPPVNLRPTQLLRCPDGKGGISLQDTPCKPPSATPGVASAAVPPEVIDLAALPPRPQAEAPAPLGDEGAPSRLTKGVLNGAWKLALLLAGAYGLFRLARYARDRFQDRFPPPEIPSRIPRRVR
jgi:hypothetical protein